MNRVEVALRGIASDLDGLHVRWALVGGFAVSVRTEPRFTRDVDVAVLVSDDPSAERLVRSLVDRGYCPDAIVEQDSVGRLATARMISPGADRLGVVVDVLFATAGIEPEIVAAAEVLEVLPGVLMPVATAGHLVALKLLARLAEMVGSFSNGATRGEVGSDGVNREHPAGACVREPFCEFTDEVAV